MSCDKQETMTIGRFRNPSPWTRVGWALPTN